MPQFLSLNKYIEQYNYCYLNAIIKRTKYPANMVLDNILHNAHAFFTHSLVFGCCYGPILCRVAKKCTMYIEQCIRIEYTARCQTRILRLLIGIETLNILLSYTLY